MITYISCPVPREDFDFIFDGIVNSIKKKYKTKSVLWDLRREDSDHYGSSEINMVCGGYNWVLRQNLLETLENLKSKKYCKFLEKLQEIE